MEVVENLSIDEGLYSRQLYVMGHEAQRRMAKSNILIIGLNGLGVEVAKNIILAGVKSVALHDNKPVSFEDLSAQFYLTQNDIGSSRAIVSAPKLSELNPYVPVSVVSGDLLSHDLSQYNVIVLIDTSMDLQLQVAQLCRHHGSSLIIADVLGAFGRVFCDFGESFTVYDIDGEIAPSSMITQITKGYPAVITVLEENRHSLSTGDTVSLSDIEGMTELNGLEVEVTVKDPFMFEIPIDTTGYTSYLRGGYVKAIKKPVSISFSPFSLSLSHPGEIVCDAMKCDRAPSLHVAFRAYYMFVEREKRCPIAGRVSDSEIFTAIAHEIVKTERERERESEKETKVESVIYNEDIFSRFSLSCRGIIAPIAAYMGGVVGQEVLKAASGKFMPIRQWFYYDILDALSTTPLTEEEVAPINSRYDSYIMLFGKQLTFSLQDLRVFLVGAGAIGCELLKNFALMGVGCGERERERERNGKRERERGAIYVTDMDRIEKSNLSRQFLFRSKHINHLKSETAGNAVKEMNPDIHTVAYDTKLAPESESFFNDDFFESLNVVFTALDNIEARLYVDQRCLFYHIPLLESGTLGAKGHTQVVVPGITEHYGATRDPPEKSFPVCTLKHFPNQIEHTLQWAREWFEEIFIQTPEDCNKYLQGGNAFEVSLASQQNMKLDTLTRVSEALGEGKPKHFKDCVVWARLRFEELFFSRIQQLLHSFPLDRLTATGTRFWSGAKKPPHPLSFSSTDPLHTEFILSVAILRAYVYNIPVPEVFIERSETSGVEAAEKYLSELIVPVFSPSDGVRIPTTEEEAKNENPRERGGGGGGGMVDVDAECKKILQSLPPPSLPFLHTIEFDKDNDNQMRVVTACSNLRARNYNIEEADLYKSRGIAGKITPAIATTTALVSGAVCLELLKVLQKKEREKLQNSFVNLALPLFTGMEPEPPSYHTVTVKGEPYKWSQWDRIDISNPNITLKELITLLDEEYGVSLSMLSSGVSILYSDFMNKKKIQERMGMNLKDLVVTVNKKEVPPEQKYIILELVANDSNTLDEVELPYLRLRLQ